VVEVYNLKNNIFFKIFGVGVIFFWIFKNYSIFQRLKLLKKGEIIFKEYMIFHFMIYKLKFLKKEFR